jgi:hypothetical protein
VDDNESPKTEPHRETQGEAEPASADASAPSPWRAKLKRWAVIGGISAVVLPIVVFVAWTAVTLKYTYSTGYRAGYVQKISKKGWICRTWEGELQLVNLPGAAPERWSFTVPDDLVAAALEKSVGSQVALEYEEHRGIPTSCFGETQYYVVGVRKVAP